MLLIGEKVDTFTYNGHSAMPAELRIIQIAPATRQLGFDYPCDIVVLGEIRATLDALAAALEAHAAAGSDRSADFAALKAKYSPSGKRPSDALILGVLRHVDPAAHLITEGSSEDTFVQDMAVGLGFRNVHFSPRGGGKESNSESIDAVLKRWYGGRDTTSEREALLALRYRSADHMT